MIESEEHEAAYERPSVGEAAALGALFVASAAVWGVVKVAHGIRSLRPSEVSLNGADIDRSVWHELDPDPSDSASKQED